MKDDKRQKKQQQRGKETQRKTAKQTQKEERWDKSKKKGTIKVGRRKHERKMYNKNTLKCNSNTLKHMVICQRRYYDGTR